MCHMCVDLTGVWSPLPVGEQLCRTSELPLLLSVSAVTDAAHVQHICTVYGLCLGPQGRPSDSCKHCLVSFNICYSIHYFFGGMLHTVIVNAVTGYRKLLFSPIVYSVLAKNNVSSYWHESFKPLQLVIVLFIFSDSAVQIFNRRRSSVFGRGSTLLEQVAWQCHISQFVVGFSAATETRRCSSHSQTLSCDIF